MHTVYEFRHGESFMNLRPDLIGGRSNETKLTANGQLQAIRLGRWIAHRGIEPKAVYSSPAARCLETAHIALRNAGLKVPIIIDDRLQELSQGVFEGRSRIGVYEDPETVAEITKLQKDFKFEGGESMNDVTERMHEWSDEARMLTGHGDVLAFTHGFAMRCDSAGRLGWTHAQIRANDVHNGHATIQDFDWQGRMFGHYFNVNTQSLPL